VVRYGFEDHEEPQGAPAEARQLEAQKGA